MRLLSALPCLLLLLSTSAHAAAPQASASVTINGKTVALTHARAWRNGAMMGVPMVSVILAEKPLDNLDWSNGDSNFSEGQRGIALRIDPSPDPKNQGGKEPYRYSLEADYEIQLHAGNYRGWNAAALTAAAQVEEISVSGGWVKGTISWKGSLPNAFSEDEVLTEYKATFSLPLEELK